MNINRFKWLLLPFYRHMQRHSVTLSQVGQDYWVYGEVFNEKKKGFFLDIGAYDGVSISNTYLLEKRYKWQGICIEANPHTYTQLAKNRNCNCMNICVDSEEASVRIALSGASSGIISVDCDNKAAGNSETVEMKAMPLEAILKEHNAPKVIDYLSIDIEGAEDRALLNFPFSDYTFHCVTIERPSNALRAKFNENGYVLIKEIPSLDCHYIHESYLSEYKKSVFAFGLKRHLVKRWL